MSNEKKPTTSEINLNKINANVFFKEFTFGLGNYIKNQSNQEVELSDNIVWLDEVAIIFEVKERNQIESNVPFENWFNNKILNKAVKQIKKTLRTLRTQQEIIVKNNRGLSTNLASIPLDNIGKVIVYDPNESVPGKFRFKKFYRSSEEGLIHLFHLEDYLWICNYLITPYEVNDYLVFREQFYAYAGTKLNEVPEQYLLGHFFSDADFNEFVLNIEDVLEKVRADEDSFFMSSYLSEFAAKLEYGKGKTNYYNILRELGKLHRNELREFKRRFLKIFEVSRQNAFAAPYRLTCSTGCGFVILALTKELGAKWNNVLTNMTLAHQYEQKINKCIGVVVFEGEGRTEMFWLYSENEWRYDEVMEKAIKELPLRPVKKRPFKGYDLG